jgi:hypothetical protein
MALLEPQYGQSGTPITDPNRPKLKLASDNGSGVGTGLLNPGTTNTSDVAVPTDFLSHPEHIAPFIESAKSQQDSFLAANAIGPDNLLPGQRRFSDETQKQISDFGARAETAGRDYVANGMEGMGDAQGMLDGAGHDRAREQTAMGGAQDPALGEALQRSSNDKFKNTLSKMKSSLEFQAPVYQAQKQAQHAQYLGQNEQNKNANFQQQVAYQFQQKQLFQQWKQAQENASTGAIGAILGGIGTVAGAVGGAIIGGPAGAAAGAAAGGALGNAASKI